MGVTIESKNHSIYFGSGGFSNLRKKVAELTAPDIAEHYKNLSDGMFLSGQERKEWFEKYDEKIEELDKKYNGEKSDILDFLYASDCSATMDVKHCKSIYEVIKDYDDNICYGYVGRSNCAMFKDFKEIVKDCIDAGTPMEWNGFKMEKFI